MSDSIRNLTPLDRLLIVIDQGLKTVAGGPDAASGSGRPYPGAPNPGAVQTEDAAAARHAAALMRVNHAGEVAAQALYHGQALVARDPTVREFLLAAAREEGDHLQWCARRLRELHSRPSLLNAGWFAGAAAIGALAGIAGDAVSLGFIAETERQVEGHLDSHLDRLPAGDDASRAILEQMKADESRHGREALQRGGAHLPPALKALMRLASEVMTRSAYLA
jgi:ubiquinone biosynthesis monooxygenase Coq7